MHVARALLVVSLCCFASANQATAQSYEGELTVCFPTEYDTRHCMSVDDARRVVQKARDAVAAGAFEKASEHITRLEPNVHAWCHLHQRTRFASGKKTDVLDSTYHKLYADLSWMAYKQGEYDRAITCGKQTRGAEPNVFAAGLFNIAKAREKIAETSPEKAKTVGVDAFVGRRKGYLETIDSPDMLRLLSFAISPSAARHKALSPKARALVPSPEKLEALPVKDVCEEMRTRLSASRPKKKVFGADPIGEPEGKQFRCSFAPKKRSPQLVHAFARKAPVESSEETRISAAAIVIPWGSSGWRIVALEPRIEIALYRGQHSFETHFIVQDRVIWARQLISSGETFSVSSGRDEAKVITTRCEIGEEAIRCHRAIDHYRNNFDIGSDSEDIEERTLQVGTPVVMSFLLGVDPPPPITPQDSRLWRAPSVIIDKLLDGF